MYSLLYVCSSIHQSIHRSIKHYRKHSLQTVGIAGIRDFSAVKCLHCHYAHHLARPEHGNLIGLWVEDLLKKKTQDEEEAVVPLTPP